VVLHPLNNEHFLSDSFSSVDDEGGVVFGWDVLLDPLFNSHVVFVDAKAISSAVRGEMG